MRKSLVSRLQSVPNEDVIQKNLETLKRNTIKKKQAQIAWYRKQQQQGTSPLRRNNEGSVLQRLGRKTRLKVPVIGTSTQGILPKKRNNFNTKDRGLVAQQRLNNIRQRQQQEHQNVIKLRRAFPRQNIAKPTNLTVAVKNSHFNGPKNNHGHKFRQVLNPVLQQEIQELQKEFIGEDIVLNVRFNPEQTKIPMNLRFASY